jgi:hypothetical protein
MSRHHDNRNGNGKPQKFKVVKGREWEIEEGQTLFRRIVVPLLVSTMSGLLVDLIWQIATKGMPWS